MRSIMMHKHVTSHLYWYMAHPRAVHGRRYSLRSAPILPSIAVLSEVGESALQETTHNDIGALGNEFDVNPSPSPFLSEVGESPGKGKWTKYKSRGKNHQQATHSD